MTHRQIPETAIERNASWIEAVEKALTEYGNINLSEHIMKAAGRKCAPQILSDCEEILGKKPETVDELLDATNQQRRKQHHLASIWKREGNRAHLEIDRCACTLVKAGLARPNPVHCQCSEGLTEHIFCAVCKGPVNVEVVRTIGQGDDKCEFYVNFQE